MATPATTTELPYIVQSLRIRHTAEYRERCRPHFFRLPREIRDLIYTYTITDEIPLWQRRHKATCVHRSRDNGPERPPFSIPQRNGKDGCLCAKRRNHSLLFVNRQTYGEACKLFYSRNEFCFGSAASAVAFLTGLGPRARRSLRKLSIVCGRHYAYTTRWATIDPLPLWQILARCRRLESLEFDACLLEGRNLLQDFLRTRPPTLTRMTAITLDELPSVPVLYRSTLPDIWKRKCFVWHEVEESIWIETAFRWQRNWYSTYVHERFKETAARQVDFIRQGGDREGRGTELDSEHNTVSFPAAAFNGRERTVRILGLPSTPKERAMLATEEFKVKKAGWTSDEVSFSPQIVALNKKMEARRKEKREQDLERERAEWQDKIRAREQRLEDEKERERKSAKRRTHRIVRSAERMAEMRQAERKRVM